MAIRPWYWPEKGQPERTEPFTWIVEGVIAASWWPDPYVFDIFEEKGIKAVVNVCEFDNGKDVPFEYDYHFIHVPDYGVPKEDQIDHFVELMDLHHAAREPVVVHCVAGCGRTGQFLVATKRTQHRCYKTSCRTAFGLKTPSARATNHCILMARS